MQEIKSLSIINTENKRKIGVKRVTNSLKKTTELVIYENLNKTGRNNNINKTAIVKTAR